MSVFDSRDFDGHEQVVFSSNDKVRLKAIIAIHDTHLGPALGGCRMWPYSNEENAVTDALRLSRGMTYKAALAGLALGGGKSVIIGDPRHDKSLAMFEAMGRAVDRLNGAYIVAEDVGTTVGDMDMIATQTSHVTGVSDGVGDPSPRTADGVFLAMRAACRHMRGRDSLAGLTVAVQGVGSVGAKLCDLLQGDGARLIVADLNTEAVNRVVKATGATVGDAEMLHAAEVDVYAPCALGGVINNQSIPQIRARTICGAANNQLAEEKHGEMLRQVGITYVPDYLANAGGLVEVGRSALGYGESEATAKREAIYDTVLEILRRADDTGVPTSEVADAMAEERFKPG